MYDRDLVLDVDYEPWCGWCPAPATHQLVRPIREERPGTWLPRIEQPCCWPCGCEQVRRGIDATLLPLEVAACG